MKTPNSIKLLETGVPNLDAILGGGLPSGCVTVIAGPPGSGKTILAQQICFRRAAEGAKVIFFTTLSEPTVKLMLYLQRFSFFDSNRLAENVRFIDLGSTLKKQGLEAVSAEMLKHLKNEKPDIVVIDSFRAFDDWGSSSQEQRNFSYQVAVNLIAWQCTAMLLGEFGKRDIETNPIFSVVDSLIIMNQREASGEQQRFLQVVKMRGAAHNRDAHPFIISSRGIEAYAPRITLRRIAGVEGNKLQDVRLKTGISTLDPLLGAGIPRGSSLLVCGDSGTGKTIFLLEFLFRGARDFGEKGLFISFEETAERLKATARGLGLDLEKEMENGQIELLFIPQPDILVEAALLQMDERIKAGSIKRVAVDSLSGFLHKVRKSQFAREKIFQLATIVQNAQAVGLFSTDLPTDARDKRRFEMGASIVDGAIFLTNREEGLERRRYLEIYKLRNTDHAMGKQGMEIGSGGIKLNAARKIEP